MAIKHPPVTGRLVTSAELVSNGTFDTNTVGWTPESDSTLASVTGLLRLTSGATPPGGATRNITLVNGATYRYLTTLSAGTAGTAAAVTLVGAVSFNQSLATSGTVDHSFVAASTSLDIYLRNSSGAWAANGLYSHYDNVSLKRTA